MPRSFLVKKVKLDDFSTAADLEHAYRHRTDLSLRLHNKVRYGHTLLTQRYRNNFLPELTGIWNNFPCVLLCEVGRCIQTGRSSRYDVAVEPM
ncbi:hypothetical protein F2P81_025801 [Scophthalmus maximus]|uniref:Uncharacterized protein n=1 Tax=Scophthalmus maximus TaxID=52904 RepID=A0A6A4RHJ4_SCOMX|nr:hypothetical protein F2P81_025801 [Scophthalmus maximus]